MSNRIEESVPQVTLTPNQQDASFHYQALTPDLILDAIESLGVFPETGLLALNSYENRVYQFRCDRGNRYVVKFYRPHRWSEAQIQEEHDYALALAAEDIPIAVPSIINGKTLHHYQGYKFTLFPSIGGRAFEVDNLDQLESVGRFIGRIHQYASKQPFQYREPLSSKILGDDALAFLQDSGQVSEGISQQFFTVAEQVLDKAKGIISAHSFPTIRLHGDLHASNILWTPDGPGFVDLDDARQGPAVQDIWMMLTGDRQQRLLQLDVLLEGYQEFYDFDQRELKLVEPLRALRMLHYNAWLTKRWQDPAFPMNFPWFGDIKYWEQQTLAFKEQLAALDEAPLSLMGY
ncbi:serine/threonine protein kinase [Shewanella sp. 1_MG-2023]|uniref:Stress response kinase A n=1 Tax=Shewanella electrodiphila TaxID=934143 RepID=A0ABT0KSU7_9GAMM|nr:MULTISPECIES: serine/threonine protein kinase [Shewanella]MCC4834682.1 serine/threonine protein kinase [Shewanella sp. 10N.7]MCL1046936.1 serine/threonine protein kinase [Shewanella electrodiphila]MDO6613592.1 serine/threonine protein kinase [Shewanella sp. 7_MG-2023]MDO6773607.1 serine/threonine protein kinase [Shewanella sp. 2_MG-2023]MDO6796134.1 serine/threonine protein kinase [Shewanella sp. 1_MG-2023]